MIHNSCRATIRPETPADREAVRGLIETAFERSAEADLVEALRNRSETVTLVAEESGGRVVGQIVFSPVRVEGHDALTSMGLAPVAVAPERQRSGVGSALVRTGLQACREQGVELVVVLGHPEYYPRFGFRPASTLGLRSEYEVPDEVFMALELVPGALAGVEDAVVRYSEPFAEL